MSDVSEVSAAFAAGDLTRVIDQTSHAPKPEHAMLRARALMRTQSNREAAQVIESIDTWSLHTVRRAEAALALSTAAARVGDFDRAEAALVDARIWSHSTPSRVIEMDVLVHRAALHLMRGNASAATHVLEEAFRLSEFPTTPFDQVVPFADVAHVKARALEITAFIANAEARFEEQISTLHDAFTTVRRSRTPDLWIRANIAATCALNARELGDTDIIGDLRDWARQVPWNDDLSTHRYHLERSFGLADALKGDQLSARRSIRWAVENAPSAPWRVHAMLDRLALLRSGRDDHAMYERELAAVRDVADGVDWRSASGESYVPLLHLAQAVGTVDPDRAERYLDLYRSIHERAGRHHGGHYDPRRLAHENFAQAVISATRGDRDRAFVLFDSAQEVFTAASCRWRAALVAVERFALSPTVRAKAIADTSVSAYRGAWFETRYATLLAKAA